MLIKDILKGLKIQDIAGADKAGVITAAPDTKAGEAARVLADKKIGLVVVVDGGGRIAGVLSERDIVRGIAAHGAGACEMPVDALMTRNVETCGLDDSPQAVMGRMSAGNFRHMPVMEGDDLVGIVSSKDIARHYAKNAGPDERAALMEALTWV